MVEPAPRTIVDPPKRNASSPIVVVALLVLGVVDRAVTDEHKADRHREHIDRVDLVVDEPVTDDRH